MKRNSGTSSVVFKLFLQNKRYFFGFLLLAPVSSLCSILWTLSLEPILSAGMALDGRRLGLATGMALVFAGLDMLFDRLLYRTRTRLLHASMDTLRRGLMTGLIASDPSAFRRRDTAGYLTLFGNDLERIQGGCLNSFCGIYRSAWGFLLSMVTLVCFSPAMGLFLLAVGFVSSYIPHFFERELEQRQEDQMAQSERHLGVLRDILGGYWIIKNHRSEEKFQEKYAEASRDLADADFQGDYAPFKAAWVPAGVTTLAFIGIISIGGYLVVRGRLAASVVLSLSQLIGGVLVPIESIPQYIAAWKGAGRVFNELTPLLTEQKPQEETPAALSAHWQTLHLEGLSFRYDEAPVLDDASLTLERGKKYVLMGRSGSGKSTLAKVLAGILPGQFRLTVDGAPEEASALRSHLSYMDQKVFLFQDTVYENISLFRCLDRDTVKEMLRRMRFDPDRMDQDAGEDGALLSGGEKQRVALARELLHQKDILILDECMAAVDQKTARDLEELVLGLDGVTCLLITHQIDDLLLRESDGLLVVENGKITVQAS